MEREEERGVGKNNGRERRGRGRGFKWDFFLIVGEMRWVRIVFLFSVIKFIFICYDFKYLEKSFNFF